MIKLFLSKSSAYLLAGITILAIFFGYRKSTRDDAVNDLLIKNREAEIDYILKTRKQDKKINENIDNSTDDELRDQLRKHLSNRSS